MLTNLKFSSYIKVIRALALAAVIHLRPGSLI